MAPPAADDGASVSAVAFGPLLMLAGIVLLVWPAASTRVLASIVGLGAVAYGVSELSRIYRGQGAHMEFSAGMIGLVSVFGGVVITITPFVNENATATVIGAYWLVGGVVEVVGGAFFRPAVRLERLLMGLISIAAAGLVLALPTPSLVLLVWFAGGWLLAAGAIVTLVGSMARPGRVVT